MALSENLARVQLSIGIFEKVLFQPVFYIPFKFQFQSLEDGFYEAKIGAFASGEFPLLKSYDLIYILPDMRLRLDVYTSAIPFSVEVSETKPFILGAKTHKISYFNPTSVSGVAKFYYYKFSEEQQYVVTWGSTIVELGDSFYSLGDE